MDPEVRDDHATSAPCRLWSTPSVAAIRPARKLSGGQAAVHADRAPRTNLTHSGTYGHSSFAPDDLTTFAHLSVVAPISARNSTAVIGIGIAVKSTSRLLMRASTKAALISRFNTLITSVGVPALEARLWGIQKAALR